MEKKEIKIVGLDLDGTLLTDKKELLPYTKNVIGEALQNGTVVLVATGRPWTGVPEELRELPGMDYALTANGARIIETRTGKVLEEHLLSKEAAKKAIAIGRKYDTLLEVYFDGQGYAQKDEIAQVRKYHKNPNMWDYFLRTRIAVDRLEDLLDEKEGNLDKVQMLFADMEEREEAWKELEREGVFELVGSLQYNIEINAVGVNKGTGLVNLGKMLGIRREEIMACGDGDNDIAIMLEVLKVIILGIVQGITEWLPISSTGHLILVEQLIQLKQSEAFTNMFNVVIQFGSILAVVVIYFHKLNPFSPTKTEKQKKMTIQLWIKVVIGTIPALIGGVLLNDLIESKLSNAYVVALMLIVYGILFIVIEKRNETREPKVKRISQLSVKTVLLIGVFQMMAMIPGTSRSGATIVGALALGVSRSVAAEFTFFLAIPVMFGASALKLFKFGLAFTPMQVFLLLLGMIVSFAVSVIALSLIHI